MAEGSRFQLPKGFFESQEDENEVLRSQDEDERRKIRENYRRFQEELAEHGPEMINPADEQDFLTQNVMKVDKLFQPVKNPREGAVDSASLVTISELGKKKAQALKTDFVTFIPSDFCDKVGVKLMGDYVSHHGLQHLNWVDLGNAVQPYLRRTPVLRFMCGSFERGDVTVKRTKSARDREKDDTADVRSTKPTQLSSFEETDRGELTTAQVEHLLDTLWKIYDKTGGPICFFEFVTNPSSFGETVENMFYASFLVRDGYARIVLDPEGLPVIEPVPREGTVDKRQAAHNQQVVLTLTPQEWEDIVRIFEIEQPLIPTRNVEAHKENNIPINCDEIVVHSQGKGKGKGKKSSR